MVRHGVEDGSLLGCKQHPCRAVAAGAAAATADAEVVEVDEDTSGKMMCSNCGAIFTRDYLGTRECRAKQECSKFPLLVAPTMGLGRLRRGEGGAASVLFGPHNTRGAQGKRLIADNMYLM